MAPSDLSDAWVLLVILIVGIIAFFNRDDVSGHL